MGCSARHSWFDVKPGFDLRPAAKSNSTWDCRFAGWRFAKRVISDFLRNNYGISIDHYSDKLGCPWLTEWGVESVLQI
jgi:hypothetical protein